MAFIVLVSFIALALAVVSESFSIIGLAATFPSIYWSVVAMGVVLGAGKLADASFLYRYWNVASWSLKLPMIFFVCVLTAITMIGHFGYLSKGYQTDSIAMKQVTVQIDNLTVERDRKIARKAEIDAQIAQLPKEYAGARIRLAKQFQDEQKTATDRINLLDTQITELKTKLIDVNSHIGPITYIAAAFGLTTDDSVKWLILIIVAVFDPLTLSLTIAVSLMLQHRRELKDAEKEKVEETPKPRIKKKQPPKEHHVETNDLFALVVDEPAPEPAPVPEPTPVPVKEKLDERTSTFVDNLLNRGPKAGTVYSPSHDPEGVSVRDPHHSK